MTSGRFGATFRQIETLMRIGPIGNLTDGQLLDRFLDRRDGGEAACESLVARHGSMVQAVCRGILGSADEADDAFVERPGCPVDRDAGRGSLSRLGRVVGAGRRRAARGGHAGAARH